ncbi:MAG: 4-hydroxybenzoate octaprenyltransferase [Gammaproteobacteria bacterium]|nr:4-hydroxybenzoate octaprenyltransferase [Gammaproteobacteria bacterium]
MKDRLYQYGLLMRMDKPIGTLLLLWPTLWALWIAGDGHPDVRILVIFVLGVFLMRSAGCVINDFADRNIDPYVKRTMNRPLAAKKVSAKEALALFVALCLAALGLVLTMNELTVLLAFPGAVLAATYPFMKRLTYLPQVHLGVAFGWAVPMAFAAQTGGVPALAWLLLVAVVLWAVAYDTLYAMVDREDDLYVGVKSTAILLGELDRPTVAALHAAVILVLGIVGQQAGMSLWYYAGLGVAALLAIYQLLLIRNREPERCFRAFLNNNWVGAAVFAGIVVDYVMRG